MKLKSSDYLFLIEQALREDLSKRGDITSQAIFQNEISTAKIVAKQSGVLSGIDVAKEVFCKVGKESQFNQFLKDGESFSPKDIILEITAPVLSLLQAERTALNFLGRLSGITTLTNHYVEKIKHTKCKILDTRKTTPGWRSLEKYAVKTGGGNNHRIGLFDMVLIKDNHIFAANGITPAVLRVRSYLDETNVSAKIEVEVSNLVELVEALSLGVDRIMLDNMFCSEMKDAVEICAGQVELEASGNVNLETVQEIAETGVDFVSVGALTHSAPCADFSMKMK